MADTVMMEARATTDTPTLAVAICTHDPRPDHLARTLASLHAQTLPTDRWRLLVIDNASTTDVARKADLSWHAQAGVVREERIGLTMARLRAIEETREELLLFVDDDNELDPGYLATMIRLATAHPMLGVFGAGRLEPEFETEPEQGLLPYVGMLALRSVPAAAWSNDVRDGMLPWGAGMMVRRSVAERYHDSIVSDPQKQRLDRSGRELNSCGDDEFSWMAWEMGLGKGIFPELRVKHLIGTARVQRAYMLRLAEGHAFSRALLQHLHGLPVTRVRPKPSFGRFIGSLLRGRFSEAMHEGGRWAAERSRTSIDREFDAVKRAGNERFFRTCHD